MSNYTPGPWQVGDLSPKTIYKGDISFAEVYIEGVSQERKAQAHANARLMAAAPELLEALKEMLETLEIFDLSFDCMHQAWQAIAKAEGGAE